MSRALRQALVTDIVDGIAGLGFADSAVYTAPGGSPVNCTVIVDDAVSPFGSFGKVIGSKASVRIQLSQIPTPVRGATLVTDGRTLTLVELVDQDASLSRWTVAE